MHKKLGDTYDNIEREDGSSSSSSSCCEAYKAKAAYHYLAALDYGIELDTTLRVFFATHHPTITSTVTTTSSTAALVSVNAPAAAADSVDDNLKVETGSAPAPITTAAMKSKVSHRWVSKKSVAYVK